MARMLLLWLVSEYRKIFCQARQLDERFLGIGLEFGLFGNWSAKIEYDYLGFGSRNATLNGSTTTFCGGDCDTPNPQTDVFSRTFRIKENIQLIKLGLNYRFDWGKAPVVARY